MRRSKNSLACTQNPLFVTSHGGLDMIFRDPTCPYGAVVVAVVVCVDVYYILYNIITTAHTRMIHHHCDMNFKDKLSLQTQMMYSTPFLLRVLGLLGLLLGLLGLLSVCSLKALLHFATNSERPNFARLCAFRLVNLAEGLLVCAAGEVNFAVCVRQARSHLFACGRALQSGGHFGQKETPNPT